jgi:hypothetical protein
LAPAFALPLLPFYFKCFLSKSSSFQAKIDKQINNHRKEKKCKEGRELSFKLSLCPPTFGFHFYPPTFALLFQTISPSIFFFSNKRKEKETKKKRTI